MGDHIELWLHLEKVKRNIVQGYVLTLEELERLRRISGLIRNYKNMCNFCGLSNCTQGIGISTDITCKKCGGYLTSPNSFTGQVRMCECNKKCNCEDRCEKCGGIK